MRYTLKDTFCSSNLIKNSLSALSLIAADSEVYQKYQIMQANIQQLLILSKQELKYRIKLMVPASSLIFTPFYSFFLVPQGAKGGICLDLCFWLCLGSPKARCVEYWQLCAVLTQNASENILRLGGAHKTPGERLYCRDLNVIKSHWTPFRFSGVHSLHTTRDI